MTYYVFKEDGTCEIATLGELSASDYILGDFLWSSESSDWYMLSEAWFTTLSTDKRLWIPVDVNSVPKHLKIKTFLLGG